MNVSDTPTAMIDLRAILRGKARTFLDHLVRSGLILPKEMTVDRLVDHLVANPFFHNSVFNRVEWYTHAIGLCETIPPQQWEPWMKFDQRRHAPLVLGKPSKVILGGCPATSIASKRLLINVPCAEFLQVKQIRIQKEIIDIDEDAWHFTEEYESSVIGHVRIFNFPKLNPAGWACVVGEYSGLVPSGWSEGDEYPLIASFAGASTITG